MCGEEGLGKMMACWHFEMCERMFCPTHELVSVFSSATAACSSLFLSPVLGGPPVGL